MVDNEGKRIFQNERALDLWRIPEDVVSRNDEEEWVRHVLSMVKDPAQFREAMHLDAHAEEEIHYEVDLRRHRSRQLLLLGPGKDGRRYGRVLHSAISRSGDAPKRRSVNRRTSSGTSLVDVDRRCLPHPG